MSKMSMRSSVFSMTIGALLFLTSGCGSSTPGSSGPSTSTVAEVSPRASTTTSMGTASLDPNCGPIPPELVGTYTSNIPLDELPPEQAGLQTGLFVVRMGPDNVLIVDPPIRHNLIDLSPTCVSGGEIAFAGEPPGGGCSGLAGGVYDWELSGTQLKLTKISDPCPGFGYIWPVHPWTKVSDDPTADVP